MDHNIAMKWSTATNTNVSGDHLCLHHEFMAKIPDKTTKMLQQYIHCPKTSAQACEADTDLSQG